MITLSLKETVSVIDNKLRLLETHNGYEYSSTQIAVSPQLAKQILLYSKQEVKDSDLAADGRESHPHITVKYGLHTDNAKEVAAVLRGVQPIRYKLGAVSMFTTNPDFNVLKVEVISPDLQRLNAKIKKELSCTDTHPQYHPHMTIAYVKKSFVMPRSTDHFEGMCGIADIVEFSAKNDKITPIRLTTRPNIHRSILTDNYYSSNQ